MPADDLRATRDEHIEAIAAPADGSCATHELAHTPMHAARETRARTRLSGSSTPAAGWPVVTVAAISVIRREKRV